MPAKSPEQQAAYDARRKRSERLLVRLSADEAQRVREAVASSGLSLSVFVLALAEGRPQPIVDLAQVAQITSAIAALADAPKALRD